MRLEWMSVPMSVAGLLMAVSLSGAAFAQDAQAYRSDISQYQTRMEQIKGGDTARYNSEVDQIKSWIEEALILIGKDEKDKVKTLVLKIGVYVDFVEASMARDKAMGSAMEAESKLKALKAEFGTLEAQVQQLTAEEEILHGKIQNK